MFTRKRDRDFADIVSSEPLFLADLSALRSLALKWFWPAFRPRSLPLLVAFSLFEYDLFVLITGLYTTYLQKKVQSRLGIEPKPSQQ